MKKTVSFSRTSTWQGKQTNRSQYSLVSMSALHKNEKGIKVTHITEEPIQAFVPDHLALQHGGDDSISFYRYFGVTPNPFVGPIYQLINSIMLGSSLSPLNLS